MTLVLLPAHSPPGEPAAGALVGTEGSEAGTRTSSDPRAGHELPDPEVGRLGAAPDPDDGAGDPVEDLDEGLDDPALYLNRELTWLAFNERVLSKACDPGTPLLERARFLAIVAGNLDEFFMKRIGGLKQQLGAGLTRLTVDGKTPAEQIQACSDKVRAMQARHQQAQQEVLAALESHGIVLTTCEQLPDAERARLRDHYVANVFPLVTPQATDPAHPFPSISNLSVNLLVELSDAGDPSPALARVKVPVGPDIPRLVQLPGSRTHVTLESIIADNLDLLFPGLTVEGCSLFRVTRNANTELDEEKADDLLELIETGMRDRKFAPIVRLEVASGMPARQRGMLAAELGLDEHTDVFEVEGMMAPRDLMELFAITDAELRDAPFTPADHPLLASDRPIFHLIREAGSLLVHHPYQSYTTSVERFLREASQDPKVRAIKATLYRTNPHSKVVEHLIAAARNDKQVAVVVELKARFEEAANIRWANRLEAAGIHVTYGVMGLKTHCKVILVVRRDYDGLRRYAHVGTGNYNAETARLYSDLGLLTSAPGIGQDLTELFNYLTTGYKPKRHYVSILPSPKHLKPALIARIEREIGHRRGGRSAQIQIKTNALEDADVTRALYRAARAGVSIDLIVRDTCRLRPGVPGLSESVRVVSVLGRFLEHTRIYHFANGGDPEYFIGSADCMQRNLERRVEVLVPVEADRLRQELRFLLDAQLSDDEGAWDMGPDGSYSARTPVAGPALSSQHALIERASRQHRDANRLKRRRSRSIRRKPSGGL